MKAQVRHDAARQREDGENPFTDSCRVSKIRRRWFNKKKTPGERLYSVRIIGSFLGCFYTELWKHNYSFFRLALSLYAMLSIRNCAANSSSKRILGGFNHLVCTLWTSRYYIRAYLKDLEKPGNVVISWHWGYKRYDRRISRRCQTSSWHFILRQIYVRIFTIIIPSDIAAAITNLYAIC